MGSDALAQARAVLQADMDAVASTLTAADGKLEAAAMVLAGCTGKVVVTGSGASAAVALRAAHLFSVAGTPAFHLPASDGLHGGLGVLRRNDVVLALSKSGSSEEVNNFCARAKTLAGSLIVITAAPGSALAQMADHALCLRLPPGTELGGIMATGSSLAMAALTDALVEVARLARGYAWEQLPFTHPSGAIGQDANDRAARDADSG